MSYACMKRAPVLCFLLFLSSSTSAMVGGASQVSGPHAAVTIVGSRGNFCTGAYVARDLVLTAAHCVVPGADYKIVVYGEGREAKLRDITRIERHPQFNIENYNKARVTADVALLKLAGAANVQPVTLSGEKFAVRPGDHFTVFGLGLAVPGDGKSGGILRSAELVATGLPGNLQIRLMDSATRNERAGLGACTGDSGAPVFMQRAGAFVVIGVVSWSTGPNNSEGCGGLTGVTPLQLYYPWLAEAARKLGSALIP